MRPSNLVYSLNDKPPLVITVLLGLQHTSIVAIGLVFPVILVRYAGGTDVEAGFMVSMSLLAAGIGVIVQSFTKGPVGSGYLCPSVCGPSFLSASIICAKTGGLPLVLGMTMVAGGMEAAFSRVLDRIRVLFPPEITGIIVAMVGISVIRLAGINLLGFHTGTFDKDSVIAGLATLAVMVGLNVWSKGNLKLFCILVGMIFGYIISYFIGILGSEELSRILDVPLVWFPVSYHPGLSFSWVMVIPFGIAMLCSSLKSIGDLTTCQKINDTDWKRPDLNNIKGGILADSIACISAGFLGGMGQSTSSTNIGLSIATGATSRVIAVSTGLILILLAFLPKFATIFAIMPPPVIGATLVFALGFMVVVGFQIIMSRMLDTRKTFVIGLSIIFGLMVDLLPEAFASLPNAIQPIFGSSLSAATLLAVFLHLLFRIGVKSTVKTEVSCKGAFSEDIFAFFEKAGGAWAARPEVVKKVSVAVSQYTEMLHELGTVTTATLTAHFDEFNFDVEIVHDGPAPPLPDKAPPPELLAENPELFQDLAGFIIRKYCDKIRTKTKGGKTIVLLKFEH